MMKKYIIISGFNTTDNNRGSAALGYGSITFCLQEGYLNEGQEIVAFCSTKNPSKIGKETIERYVINGKLWTRRIINVSAYEHKFFRLTGFSLPFTRYGKLIHNIELVAAINGGDGFSDIYGTKTFLNRLSDTIFALKANIPLIILPQTLGPFSDKKNYDLGKSILQYASKVYVRDLQYTSELEGMDVNFTISKDLSAYMLPEAWDIVVPTGSIGINISGLCYSNAFRSLSGQFDAYPQLIDRLISHFQRKGKMIFLIPHSYHYGFPEPNNDDMEACQMAYNRLHDKTNVTYIDKNLLSPQVKYLISKMSFFIGSRMHANFAAIYSKVPVFGLAYSYKFKGAFDANGLDGMKQTAMINNIKQEDIEGIIQRIENFYIECSNNLGELPR